MRTRPFSAVKIACLPTVSTVSTVAPDDPASNRVPAITAASERIDMQPPGGLASRWQGDESNRAW
jgi:hypothetical protein